MEVAEIVPVAPPTLKTFLTSLNYPLVTLSIQNEAKGATRPRGRWFSPKNWVRAIPFNELFTEEVIGELQSNQEAGNAIYFLINEGNGEPKNPAQGDLNCGRKENIINLRTLAIDTDNADIGLLKEKLQKINLFPHFIVETSPRRYHIYFLIQPEPALAVSVKAWQDMQKFLHELLPGMDKSMTDITQVLRLPGFLHLKGAPFKVRIVDSDPTLPYHNLAELNQNLRGGIYHDILGKDFFKEYINGEAKGKKKYVEPVGYLEAGGRRAGITAYMEHIIESQVKLDADIEIYYAAMDAFIRKHIKPIELDEFLNPGKRRTNLETYVRDQIKWRADQYHKYEESLKRQEEIEKGSLPDDFYLNFPGDLGKITGEIKNYVPFLSLEMCFAGALCISGMIKGDFFRYEGFWPYINGFIIAGSGSGKSTLKHIITKTLSIGGFEGIYPRLIDFHNSVQSLYMSFYESGAAATLIIDEAGDYIKKLTAKNAGGHERDIKKFLKEATTGRGQGYKQHCGFSMKYRTPPSYGLLSVWMLIQPGMFEQTLNSDDVDDGFLPRFFVFNGNVNLDIDKDESNAGDFIPSQDLIVMMESFNALRGQINIIALEEKIEKEAKESKVKVNLEDILNRKRAAIYNARYEARCLSQIDVEITEEAKRRVSIYMSEQKVILDKIVKEQSEDASSVSIIVRIKEMLKRLMCNACELNNGKALITEEIAMHCIRFQEFQVNRFFHKELKQINQSSNEKYEEVVLKAVTKAHDKYKRSVSLREITHSIAARNRPPNIRKVIDDLVKSKEIWVQSRPHERVKDKWVTEYYPAKSEDLV